MANPVCLCGKWIPEGAPRCTRCGSQLCQDCAGNRSPHGYCPQCQKTPADFKPPEQQPGSVFQGADYMKPTRGPR